MRHTFASRCSCGRQHKSPRNKVPVKRDQRPRIRRILTAQQSQVLAMLRNNPEFLELPNGYWALRSWYSDRQRTHHARPDPKGPPLDSFMGW